MELDDKTIIKKLKSNNQDIIDEGFEELYLKYSKLIYVCIKRYIKRKEDIEDLLSDTFLKIFENRLNLRDDKNFKYYLTTTANNLAINFLKNKNNDYDILEYEHFDTYESNNDDLKDMIDILKSQLEQDEVDIIIQHLIYAYTFEDIAKQNNLNVSTVKTKYFRAIKKVKV